MKINLKKKLKFYFKKTPLENSKWKRNKMPQIARGNNTWKKESNGAKTWIQNRKKIWFKKWSLIRKLPEK